MENIIKMVGSGILTGITFLFGEFNVAMQVLIFCIVIDYLSGIAKAYVTGELDSTKGLKGIIKKVGYLVIVALAFQIDRMTGNTEIVKTAVSYFFVVNESLSILENCGKMGLPIPKVLLDKLEQLKNKNEN